MKPGALTRQSDHVRRGPSLPHHYDAGSWRRAAAPADAVTNYGIRTGYGGWKRPRKRHSTRRQKRFSLNVGDNRYHRPNAMEPRGCYLLNFGPTARCMFPTTGSGFWVHKGNSKRRVRAGWTIMASVDQPRYGRLVSADLEGAAYPGNYFSGCACGAGPGRPVRWMSDRPKPLPATIWRARI